MKQRVCQLQLKTKALIGVTVLVLFMALMNFAYFLLMRSNLSRLSSMIDITIATNQLKNLAGTPTAGLPELIALYSLHPEVETKVRIEEAMRAIELQIDGLTKVGLTGERKVLLELLRNMFTSYPENFRNLQAEIKGRGDSVKINRYVATIRENSLLIGETADDLISMELSEDQILKSKMTREADQDGIRALLLMFLLSGLAFSIFYVGIMKNGILGPLDEMGLAMDHIANDPRGVHVRVESASDDEVGKLALHFNQMADSVQKYRDHLEDLVASRTSQLEATQAMLTESAKLSALGEMAGGVAHEINTPLATIQLNVGILRDLSSDPKPNVELIKKASERIERTVDRIAKIIRGLRMISRDATQDPFIPATIEGVLEDAVSLCSEKMRLRGIRFEVGVFSKGTTIECRQVEISQVLLNLLNNSADAVEGQENAWVNIDSRDLGKHIELTVTDSGPGIPDSVRAKMFQPFFTTKQLGKGTGLGLSISKAIIEAHGGKLNIDDGSANTRFVVVLPKQHDSTQNKRAA